MLQPAAEADQRNQQSAQQERASPGHRAARKIMCN
jgi:hypothetical protein